MWRCLIRAMEEEDHVIQINKDMTLLSASGNNIMSKEEELVHALLEQSDSMKTGSQHLMSETFFKQRK